MRARGTPRRASKRAPAKPAPRRRTAPTKPAGVRRTVLAYAEAVAAGRLPACRLHRLVAERFVADLRDGPARGLVMDWEEAEIAVQFAGLLRHSKGEWAGRVLALEPWQQFIMANLQGWRRASDGCRRFRTSYVEVPRKNGKSTFGAAVGLLGLLLDNEPGAEIYSAATKRDQARIIHEEAMRMARGSPSIRRRVQFYRDSLFVPSTQSTYRPLGADADTMDGLNPQMAIVDELHAHKSADLWNVLETASGARRQPLQSAWTTAGFDQTGICYALRGYCEQVLDPAAEVLDDTLFAFVASIDEGDDWTSPAAWAKANPNLGVSVKLDDIQRQAAKAGRVLSLQASFRTKRLNEWVASASSWIDLREWDACAGADVPDETLRGLPCWGGLDLASVRDLAAFVLAWPLPDGSVAVRLRCWLPAETAAQRSRDDRVPYLIWAEQAERTGLTLTPGCRIDYRTIRDDLLGLGRAYRIQHVGADPWNYEYLRQELEGAGVELVEMGQGFRAISPAIRKLEGLLAGRQLHHGGNPILRWAAQNVTCETDPLGNVRFSKKKSRERIDPVMALAMAVGVATIHPEAEGASAYGDYDAAEAAEDILT